MALDKLGEIFNQKIVPTSLFSEKLLIHPTYRTLIIIESDHRVYSQNFKNALKAELAKENPKVVVVSEQQIGVPKIHAGAWVAYVTGGPTVFKQGEKHLQFLTWNIRFRYILQYRLLINYFRILYREAFDKVTRRKTRFLKNFVCK